MQGQVKTTVLFLQFKIIANDNILGRHHLIATGNKIALRIWLQYTGR